ncbi:two-component system response regulator [Alsobacter metallidurans]|jgi:two-component system chemotaxis response regulator CheY|uniref:Two-component system response regulator n=1 Tax=Alsobacter metallidurans TaxID=340221 RepID=A0A917I5L8_9HYPH|nr:response regulator [Alsobacter metallidurans]GGH13663.1 two-component system response regulator [Alsobacter metallidurans]
MSELKSKKVLVVDDQKSMRGLLRFALLQMGFETIDGAESGEEAIKKLTTVRYDLIITDMHMGGVSGLGLLKAIRQHPVLRHTPVIMATSETSSDTVRQAKQLGVDAFILKPVDPNALQLRVKTVLKAA